MEKFSETVKLNDLECYYEVYGQGEPLFLLHGWTQTTVSWEDYIEGFKDQFRVYVVDLLGHGKSSPLKTTFRLEDAAQQLIRLMDHLGIKSTKAIGFSYGGELLLRASAEHPERFDSMILIGASHRFEKHDWGFTFEILNKGLQQFLLNTHAQGEEQVRLIFKEIENYESILSETELQQIKVPTLVMVGDQDEFVDLETAVNLHQSLPQSHLWIVPNSGHLAFGGMMEEQFIQTANEFLSGMWHI